MCCDLCYGRKIAVSDTHSKYLTMKHLFLAALVSIVFACNSDTKEGENHADSSHTSTNNNQDASGNNPVMDMHNAMNSMMDQMKNMKPTGDADHDFAMMMKHHHQGAIDMAKLQIEGGSDTALKAMAQHAINEQQGEIAAFDRIMKGNQPSGSSDYGQKAMKMMTPMNDIKMEGGSLDAMFASMMIPHHQDAVKMSEEYLKVGKNEELKRIGRSIMLTQPREIKALQDWLNRHKKSKE